MRSISSFVPFPALFLLSSCVLYSVPLAAQQKTPPPPNNPNAASAPVRSFSVNGMVSDAANHTRLDLVRLELRSGNSAVVGTVFTSTNGTFHFDNVGSGDYTLVADQPGYQSVSQQVEVFDSSVYGVQIELVRVSDSDTSVTGGPSSVSVRELSIPRKAHDEMEMGMALLYGKSDFQGSLKPFEKAIKEYPDYYEAYAQIGVAYMKLADTVNAEKAFRKSIEVSHEKYPDAYFGLGEVFLNTKRFADAASTARKAIEIDPQSWQAQSQLARTLVELQRPAEAEPSAVAAVLLKPDNPTLYLVLANIHIQLQNNPALLDDLTHYLKLAPDGPFAEQARRERDQIQQALAASQSSPAATSPPQP
jgi:cytochrome c-type biogenesis protein CcmH/NrfG